MQIQIPCWVQPPARGLQVRFRAARPPEEAGQRGAGAGGGRIAGRAGSQGGSHRRATGAPEAVALDSCFQPL